MLGLLCTFHKPTTKKMLSRTSDQQTPLASALWVWSYEWRTTSYSHLSKVWEFITEWQIERRGSLTDRPYICSFGRLSRKLPFPFQHTYIYPSALFDHLLLCFWKTVHMCLIKLWVRGMMELEDTKYLRSSVSSVTYGHIVFNYH